MIGFVKSTESAKNLGFQHLNQSILFDLTMFISFLLIIQQYSMIIYMWHSAGNIQILPQNWTVSSLLLKFLRPNFSEKKCYWLRWCVLYAYPSKKLLLRVKLCVLPIAKYGTWINCLRLTSTCIWCERDVINGKVTFVVNSTYTFHYDL